MPITVLIATGTYEELVAAVEAAEMLEGITVTWVKSRPDWRTWKWAMKHRASITIVPHGMPLNGDSLIVSGPSNAAVERFRATGRPLYVSG